MIELCYFSLNQWEMRIHLLWGKCFNIPHHWDPHLNQTKLNDLLPLTIDGVLTEYRVRINKSLCALLDQSQDWDIFVFFLWNNCFHSIPISERNYTILLWSSFEHNFVFAFNAKAVKGAYIKEYLRIHTSLLFNPKMMKKNINILPRGHINVQDGLD